MSATQLMLDEVSAFIAAQINKWVVGTNLFMQQLPDSPDVCAVVYEYAGRNDFFLGGGLPGLEVIRVQLLVRGVANDYKGPRLDCEDIRRALTVVGSQTLSGTRYLRIMADDTPTDMGPDPKNRSRIVCNFEITKELSV